MCVCVFVGKGQNILKAPEKGCTKVHKMYIGSVIKQAKKKRGRIKNNLSLPKAYHGQRVVIYVRSRADSQKIHIKKDLIA